jgi:hypothetical protein
MITDSQAWFLLGFAVGGLAMCAIWIILLRNYKLNKKHHKNG